MWDKPPSQLIKAGGERGELSLRGHWGLGWLSAETGRPVATLGGLHSSFFSPQASGSWEEGEGRDFLQLYVPGWAQGWGWSRKHGTLLGLRAEVAAALF